MPSEVMVGCCNTVLQCYPTRCCALVHLRGLVRLSHSQDEVRVPVTDIRRQDCFQVLYPTLFPVCAVVAWLTVACQQAVLLLLPPPPPGSTMFAMALTIPIEIQEYIIDCLREDPPSLHICSQVCQAWLPRTRIHLFRTISLHTSQDPVALRRFFQEKPFLKSFVQQLSVSALPYIYPNPTLFETIPIQLLPELPFIQALSFSDRQQTGRPRYFSFRPVALACLARYSLVQTLSLGPLAFSTCTELVQLVSAFPALLRLRCAHVKIRRQGGGVELASRRARVETRITTLEVGLVVHVREVSAFRYMSDGGRRTSPRRSPRCCAAHPANGDVVSG